MKKRAKYTVIMLVTVAAMLAAGFLPQDQSRDFRIAKNLDIFFSLFRELNSFYVDEIDPDKVVRTGINSMLQSLDPYTEYYSETELDDIAFMTTGKYGGIGAMIRNSGDYAVVTQIYKGFPADIAGIKPGDLLKKVDNKSLKGLPSDKVSDNLKGDPGTTIEITVERNGSDLNFTLKRDRVAVSPVPFYGMLDANTAYIRFTNFTQNCGQDVRNALVDLRTNHNPTQVILDLRGNPGGLMNEATEVVNIFVPAGNEVVSTRGKVKQFDTVSKTTRQPVDTNIPLVVLISRGSASAAEIVAGAIQDLDRGVVMGQRSFGKGLVQVTRPLSYNGQLKVTTAKYYIPSGRCIQALDFTHRNEDGSVGYIPDSLISSFKTKNGRIVKDGGGITPDLVVTPPMLSQVATELYINNHIFDFATHYYHKNPDIKTVAEIRITDEVYTSFAEFLKSRNFTYKTATATALETLISTARREKYYDLHAEAFSALENNLAINPDNDLALFRAEIAELLEDEIAERYFYQEGAIENAVRKDSTVLKAVELLNNRDKYQALLKPASANR
jgi:carboxyl-terminal processing protease